MTFYEPGDCRQQAEILRRFSSDVLNDKAFERYAPYRNTEEIEGTLMYFFFSHCGITNIALYYGCPETIIMEKILSMDLYFCYDELIQQLRNKNRELYSEPCNDLFLPRSQHEKDVEALRRSTPMYPVNQFEWTEERRNMVFWLFKMGEDVTDIALLLGCPEWMVMKDFIDDHLYDSWDTPWFRYSSQECRDNYLSGYHF